MKKIILLVLSLLVISGIANAQFEIPFTPFLDNYMAKITKANKVHVKQYNNYEILNEYDVYYQYSLDSMGVVIRGKMSDSRYDRYITYYPDGKMKTFKQLVSGYDDTFTYTDDGRILEINSTVNRKLYYYTNTGTDSIVAMGYNKIQNKFIPVWKNIIIYNSNGYEVYDFQYSLDLGDYANPKKSIYKRDLEGRIIEQDFSSETYYEGCKYFYTENGYTQIVYNRGVEYNKCEYTFNDKGDLLKSSLFFWNATGQYWMLDNTCDYTYYYSNATSNDNIEKHTCGVSVQDKTLLIKSDTPNKNISIYSIYGKLLRQVSLNDNIIQIPMESGVYLIRIGEENHKVMIR